MSIRKYFFPILVLIIFSFDCFSQKWDLKKDKDGVKVYTRGIETSNIQEFKGEVIVKSNMSGVLKVIDSVGEYPKWMKNCCAGERLKKVSGSSGYNYYAIKAPWPVSDRDACTYYSLKQDTSSKVVTVTIKGVKDYLPQKSGRVRVPTLNGFWQLIPMAKGITKIVYQVHCDIGGLVPAAIINLYIADTPFSDLLTIKKIVESPLYPKTVMKNVREIM
jgi:hypothetical protein